ncbi:hypothetical protein C5167_009570 [Papaver somniferum]|uniref:Uncharacterized protein n=1 Tax=Papaver somniferum TaxID=3469 RepID=A0A4Y7JXU1_PAPSO|nr:hypothetical protein C5167_009570 [Papaver somniferum]
MWIARVAIDIIGVVNVSLHRCRTRRVVVVGSCVKLQGGGIVFQRTLVLGMKNWR